MLYTIGWIDRAKPVNSENAYHAKDVKIPNDLLLQVSDYPGILIFAAKKVGISERDIVLCVPADGYFHLHSQVLARNGE